MSDDQNKALSSLSNVLPTVAKIALPDTDEDLRVAHSSWFLCLRKTMSEGGYSAVKIKFPGVSEEFARGVEKATSQQLLTLCNGEISLLKPAIGEKEFLNTLSNTHDASMILLMQMLTGESQTNSPE